MQRGFSLKGTNPKLQSWAYLMSFVSLISWHTSYSSGSMELVVLLCVGMDLDFSIRSLRTKQSKIKWTVAWYTPLPQFPMRQCEAKAERERETIPKARL